METLYLQQRSASKAGKRLLHHGVLQQQLVNPLHRKNIGDGLLETSVQVCMTCALHVHYMCTVITVNTSSSRVLWILQVTELLHANLAGSPAVAQMLPELLQVVVLQRLGFIVLGQVGLCLARSRARHATLLPSCAALPLRGWQISRDSPRRLELPNLSP